MLAFGESGEATSDQNNPSVPVGQSLSVHEQNGYNEGEAAGAQQEKAENAEKVITEIKYKPSSGAILRANPDKTTTIIGNFKNDMINIISELGDVKSTYFGARKGRFNVLNVPDDIYKSLTPKQFWERYNKRWLDMAISRGDDIILATVPEGDFLSYIDNDTGKEVITGFGSEYNYLREHNYIYDAATHKMVPKWRRQYNEKL